MQESSQEAIETRIIVWFGDVGTDDMRGDRTGGGGVKEAEIL